MKQQARPSTNLPSEDPLIDQVAEIIETDYDLGSVTKIEQLFGGYTNQSFAVSTEKNGQPQKHFFRKYRKNFSTEEVAFELAMIDHVTSRGADIVAGVIPARDGRAYVYRLERDNDREDQRFFATFEFIGGEDKYTWTQNHLNGNEYASAGTALAELHSAAQDFSVRGLKRPRPTILQVVPQMENILRSCISRAANTIFDTYFLRNLEDMLSVTARTTAALDDMRGLPRTGIHGDYHPGNQKYHANGVAGIFDFDRANIDLRLFDVALAVTYFCSEWESNGDGALWLEKSAIFLLHYQQRARELGTIGPMSLAEARHFPRMLAAANLTTLKWATFDAYYAGDEYCNDEEYLTYLRHNTRLMRWIESHQREVAQMVTDL